MGANLAARVTLTPKETQVYTPMNTLLIYLAVGTEVARQLGLDGPPGVIRSKGSVRYLVDRTVTPHLAFQVYLLEDGRLEHVPLVPVIPIVTIPGIAPGTLIACDMATSFRFAKSGDVVMQARGRVRGAIFNIAG